MDKTPKRFCNALWPWSALTDRSTSVRVLHKNAARVTRLNNGAVLRRVACLQIEDEDWCEIETLDGSLEGWASAVYLRPWFGADPAVLETLALPAGETVSLALPGGTTGVLKPGEIIDVQIEASAETAISFYFDGPEGVEMAIFEQQGESDHRSII